MLKHLSRILLTALFLTSQLSCAGNNTNTAPSISGVELLNTASYQKILGQKPKIFSHDKILYSQHYNQTGYEMLTVISKPENKYLPIKLQVAKLDRPFMLKRNELKEVKKFTTHKGIQLGMTPNRVETILGKPTSQNTNTDGIATWQYEQTSVKHQNKSSSYISEYRFHNKQLIEYKIGLSGQI